MVLNNVYASHLEAVHRTIIECHGEPGAIWPYRLPLLLESFAETWSLIVPPPFPNLTYHHDVAPAILKV